MIDINLIREDPQGVQEALQKRGQKIDFAEFLSWDEERRSAIGKVESLKARRNKVSADIPRLKKDGQDVQALMAEMKEVSAEIKALDSSIAEIGSRIKNFLDVLPNLPAPEVPAGGKENNKVIKTWGERPDFDFDPKDHSRLVVDLGLIDYERGVKLGGNGFWIYKGQGALLEWAMINYFVGEHLKDGYEFILPPHILVDQCGYTAGQFPKFREDVYHLQSDDGEPTHFLLPTAETALINYHRDEIIPEESLPLKYFAYTPCYRREAGSYRAQERGMIRGHQFNKVEMFQYTRPENSEKAHEELLQKAERLVQGLGLHHRITLLAAEDMSASMVKTFDIEVWIPSMDEYKEVTSISNGHAYQARRGNIRFKRSEPKRNEFVHSLNASGLATSRLMPAIVEQFQQKDGSVIVPEVLREFVGTDVIRP